MSHEMDDLKHNNTFKAEQVEYSRDFVRARPVVLKAIGQKGSGKTMLLIALGSILQAAGYTVSLCEGGEDEPDSHTLVVERVLAPTPLGRLRDLIQPHSVEPGKVEFRSTELQEARDERDAWKRVAERAGVCMTCALGHAALDNGTPGCTDCLNSGWRDGAPEGFTPNNGPEVMQFPHEDAIRIVSDNGKRWRIQGPGWIMQPTGHVSADQAREICERALLPFVVPDILDKLAHVRGDTVIARPNPMVTAGRERAKRCSSEHCKDGYCRNWHAPHACDVKDETVIARPAYKKPQPETVADISHRQLAHAVPLGGSVVPSWVTDLSYQQQSVLLLALRGPDGIRKYHPAKPITVAYRGTMLRAAERERFLLWGEKADDFMSLEVLADDYAWRHAIKVFFQHVDELPHHYVGHIAHAAQIIGYKHPDVRMAQAWMLFYLKWCHDLHVNHETEADMDGRLGDWGKAAARKREA